MTIIALVLVLAVAGIAFFNMDPTTLSLYFMSVTVPLWLIILGATLIGMLIAFLLSGARMKSSTDDHRKREEDLREKLKEKDEELETTRHEKKDIASRTRKETEMELQMQQKDGEIEALHQRLAALEQTPSQQHEDPRYSKETTAKPEVVYDPGQANVTASDKDVNDR